MKTLLVSLLLFISFILNAQTFERIISLADFTRPYFVLENNQGYVISTTLLNIDDYEQRKSNVLLLNKNGDIIINKEFREYYMQTITTLWNINDSIIGALGYATAHPDSMLKVIYYHLDKELNIELQTEYPIQLVLNSNLITDICLNHKQNIVYQLSYFDDSYENRGYIFFEFSNEGKVINKNFYPNYYLPIQACITNKTDGGYYMFQENMCYELDSLFNKTDSLDFNPDYTNSYPNYGLITDVIWENDSMLLMSVPYNADNDYYYMGISRTKYGKEIIEDKFYDWNELYEMYPFYNSFDTVGNYFYLAATTNFSGGPFFEERLTGIRIIKANKDFSINWDKTYRQDANNYMYYLIGTRDGGCMITGTRYDFTQPEQRLDLYILKVDSLGNYIPNTVEDIAATQQGIKVYPNPGFESFNISVPIPFSNAVLSLYNMAGTKVLSKKLSESLDIIITENLPNGIYSWEVIAEDFVLERGKWVKQ